MGVPYFIYAFLKITMYLLDVFVYKTVAPDAKGVIYIIVQLLFMIAALFVIRLGIKELTVKPKNSKEITRK